MLQNALLLFTSFSSMKLLRYVKLKWSSLLAPTSCREAQFVCLLWLSTLVMLFKTWPPQTLNGLSLRAKDNTLQLAKQILARKVVPSYASTPIINFFWTLVSDRFLLQSKATAALQHSAICSMWANRVTSWKPQHPNFELSCDRIAIEFGPFRTYLHGPRLLLSLRLEVNSRWDGWEGRQNWSLKTHLRAHSLPSSCELRPSS